MRIIEPFIKVINPNIPTFPSAALREPALYQTYTEAFEERDRLKTHIYSILTMAGKTCYKTDFDEDLEALEAFVGKIVDKGHLSVIEHYSITFLAVCDRGVSHELVRHRLASYSQESTRYCNYSHGKFGHEITVIRPPFFPDESQEYWVWYTAMKMAEEKYMLLLDSGATAQEARSVLPNSLKTEVVVTMNLRELGHFFKLRISQAAHPQMRQIALPFWSQMAGFLPELFELGKLAKY
jgi:thymidylate synthase (FAD)